MGSHSFVACLSHLTIGHASLPRRSTVAAPNRHLQHLGAHYVLAVCFINIFCLPPCCFAVCGHNLSPTIAIVFSLLSSVPNFSMPHSFIFLISNTSRSPGMFHILPLCEFYSLLLCHKGTSLLLFPPPLDYWYTSFFFLAGPGPLH